MGSEIEVETRVTEGRIFWTSGGLWNASVIISTKKGILRSNLWLLVFWHKTARIYLVII